MDVHQRAARILDAVFDHAEENKGLVRTVLQKTVEDILLAHDARMSWERPAPYPERVEPNFKYEPCLEYKPRETVLIKPARQEGKAAEAIKEWLIKVGADPAFRNAVVERLHNAGFDLAEDEKDKG